jgi:hypothetical protein
MYSPENHLLVPSPRHTSITPSTQATAPKASQRWLAGWQRNLQRDSP